MEDSFKKIAASLGLVIPTCLLSFTSANAAESSTHMGENLSIQKSLDYSNDVVARLMTQSIAYTTGNDLNAPHTDTHTDMGGNHADSHANYSHTDSHSDYTRGTGDQCVHTNRHTNSAGTNRHTNSGNPNHTDHHTNKKNSSC